MSGQEQVERDGGGLELVGQLERRRAEGRDQPLEALLAGRVEQEARKGEVVLDDEQHLVAGLDVVAVVADLVDEARLSLNASTALRRVRFGAVEPPNRPVEGPIGAESGRSIASALARREASAPSLDGTGSRRRGLRRRRTCARRAHGDVAHRADTA